jgi:hypothetical protein
VSAIVIRRWRGRDVASRKRFPGVLDTITDTSHPGAGCPLVELLALWWFAARHDPGSLVSPATK